MIRLQFSTAQSVASDVVRRVTHSPFSHVDALTDDGYCLGALDAPGCRVLEGTERGVALRPGDYQRWATRRVAHLSTSPETEATFWDLLREQLGKPYDWGAIAAFLVSDVAGPRDWRDGAAWFCSEMLAWALERSGAWPYPLLVGKDRVTPADLLLLVTPLALNGATFFDPVPDLALTAGES